MQKCFCGEVLWKWNSCGQWCDDSQGTQWCVCFAPLSGKEICRVLIIDSGSWWFYTQPNMPSTVYTGCYRFIVSEAAQPATHGDLHPISSPLLLLSGWLNLNLLISPQCGQRCGMCQSIYFCGIVLLGNPSRLADSIVFLGDFLIPPWLNKLQVNTNTNKCSTSSTVTNVWFFCHFLLCHCLSQLFCRRTTKIWIVLDYY